MKTFYSKTLLGAMLCIVTIGQSQINVQIPILEDTYIDGFSTTTNRGAAVFATVKYHPDGRERTVLLKFDVSSVTETITNATLYIDARTVKTDATSAVIIDVYKHDDNWAEATTTFDNYVGTIGTKITDFESPNHTSDYDNPFTIDITSYAEEARTGDGVLSLAFKMQNTNNQNDFRIVTKEDVEVEPVNTPAYLIITGGTLSTKDFSANTFKLYPNPVNDKLNIQSPNSKISRINIFSIDGKKVLEIDEIDSNKIEFDVSYLNKGIYLIQLLNNDGGSNTKRLIKN